MAVPAVNAEVLPIAREHAGEWVQLAIDHDGEMVGDLALGLLAMLAIPISFVNPRAGKGSGKAGNDEARNSEPIVEKSLPKCPCCQQPMPRIARIFPGWQRRIITQPQQSRAPPSEVKGGPQA